MKRKGIVIIKTMPMKMFNCKGGKIVCKLNELPCLQYRRVRNDLRLAEVQEMMLSVSK